MNVLVGLVVKAMHVYNQQKIFYNVLDRIGAGGHQIQLANHLTPLRTLINL